jgi:hypothetical protein
MRITDASVFAIVVGLGMIAQWTMSADPDGDCEPFPLCTSVTQ